MHVTEVVLRWVWQLSTFDSMIHFVLCNSEEEKMTTCRNEEMKCIGAIDKLPVLSGDGETVAVNGLNGFCVSPWRGWQLGLAEF